MRPFLAFVLIGSALGAQAPAPIVNTERAPDWIQGRWVTPALPAALNFVGDSLEVMIIPLQGPLMSYRVRGNRIEVKANGRDGPPADMRIRRDSLFLKQGATERVAVRVDTARWDSTSLEGSWRSAMGLRRNVMTFRSDDIMISEDGSLTDPNYRGDTLDVTFGTQVLRFTYRRSGDTLLMRSVRGGNEQPYVRKPWGCFGMPTINKDARGCR